MVRWETTRLSLYEAKQCLFSRKVHLVGHNSPRRTGGGLRAKAHSKEYKKPLLAYKPRGAFLVGENKMETRKEQDKTPACTDCKTLRHIWLEMNRDKMDITEFRETLPVEERFDGLGIA